MEKTPKVGEAHQGNTEPSRRCVREGVETRRGLCTCRVCGQEKEASLFYKKDRRSGRLDSTCKACRLIQERERVLGITNTQYQDMHRKQRGRCAICSKRIGGRRYKALCADHCHSTGRFRGLLCGNCNRGLGYFKDSQALLSNAIEYIKV